MSTEPTQFDRDYDAALASFKYIGGVVRLAEQVTDPILLAREWGATEKDPHCLPFGPWSYTEHWNPDEPHPSAGPWVWRFGTAQAATGSRYAVLATRVHKDIAKYEGGHIIVSVMAPWSAVYPLAEEGFLHHSYVADKLTGGRAAAGALHGGDLAALTKLVGILLSRETG